MPKQDKKQQALMPENEWDSLVQSAKELPEIYPKIKFGDNKMAEVAVEIEIVEPIPRIVEFTDKFSGKPAKALFMNCRVLTGPEAASMRSLGMPLDENHGLTRGVLNVAKRHGNRLDGIKLRIETRNYDHEEFGKTRGYVVSELTTEEQPDQV